MGERFKDRVAELRATWSERRDLRQVRSGHDFETLFESFLRIYRWSEICAGEIQFVYGEHAPTQITEIPDRCGTDPSFQVQVGTGHLLTFFLARQFDTDHWRIEATVALDGGPPVPATTSRAGWTRRSLEDLFLRLMTAFERSYTEGDLIPRPRSLPHLIERSDLALEEGA
jgi:hypothetical protein